MRRRDRRVIHGHLPTVTAAVVLAVAAPVVAACGDDGESDAGTVETTDQVEATDERQGFDDSDTRRYGKPRSREPKVEIPSGPPPKQLKTEDLRQGSGPAVDFGDEAIVNYVGYHYSTKRRYDTSYGLNPVPYKVYPGDDHMIEGFEEGIVGMKVGGRRMITIPPHKAYGDRGYTGQVKPGETLMFVVDLEALEKRE